MKLTLSDILSSYLSVDKINTNFSAIETAFDNTLSRDGTTPNAMGAPIDMGTNRIINLGAPVDDTDAVRKMDLVTGGTLSLDWSIITNKPTDYPTNVANISDFNTGVQNALVAGSNITITPNANGTLTLASASTVGVDWSAITNKPTTFTPAAHVHPESDITNLSTDLANKADIGHTHVYTDITDFGTGVAASITAGANITLTTTSGVTTITAAGSGASGQKPPLLNSYGTVDATGATSTGNDTAFAAAESDAASAIYIDDGTYLTTRDTTTFTKQYVGRGKIKFGTTILPAKYHYMNTKPTTAATQGLTGWFDGDQRFSDGGEYHIIGANVREYDITSRYFESNTIPHHAWLDVHSGNSGVQAWLTSGANAGDTTITIHAPPSSEWVGKTVAFALNMDGSVQESHTVTAVGPGNTITIDAGLTNSYVWDVNNSKTPGIFFGHRTWAGHKYIKVETSGGGDSYGHLVRMVIDYVPKPSETHCFMAATGGQYGGDVAFNADGVYATGWESQYSDQGHDVRVIAQVDSFTRTKDTSMTNGSLWAGTFFQSVGSRPSDVAHSVLGFWRVGLDTAFGSLLETTYLVDNTIASATNIRVNSLNGAVVGDPIQIGEWGAFSWTGTIVSINTSQKIIQVTPALPATVINSGTLVTYPYGGAVLNMQLGQRIVFNSTRSNNARSGDPLGVYSVGYGNVQGDMIMETGTDSTSDFWAVRFNGNGHGGANARIRLRPNANGQTGVFNSNVPIQCGATVEAATGLVTDGGLLNHPTVYFGSGSGNYIQFNTVTGKFEFYKGNNLAYSI